MHFLGSRTFRSTLAIVTAAALVGCGGEDLGQAKAVAAGLGTAAEAASAAASAAGVAVADSVGYNLETTGDLELKHSGKPGCEIYEDRLLLTFTTLDGGAMFGGPSYDVMVRGFEGEGRYEGTFTLKDDGETSGGTVTVTASVAEGRILPVMSGRVSGQFSGALGSGVIEGDYSCKTDLGRPGDWNSGPKSGAWVEYRITGDAEASHREEEVVMCSESDQGFRAHSMGSWSLSFETEIEGRGEMPARFTLGAPLPLRELRPTGSADPRFYGDGTVTVEDAGTDEFGLKAVRVKFSAPEVEQGRSGPALSVDGELFCGVM